MADHRKVWIVVDDATWRRFKAACVADSITVGDELGRLVRKASGVAPAVDTKSVRRRDAKAVASAPEPVASRKAPAPKRKRSRAAAPAAASNARSSRPAGPSE